MDRTVRALAVIALILLVGCPAPTPTPSPSPTVEPTPTPMPTPVCIGEPPTEEQTWTPVEGDLVPMMRSPLLAAMHDLGSPCGAVPEETLDRLATDLLSRGACAGRMTDAVFIQRPPTPDLWEQYHPVYYGDGCWTAAPLKGVWRRID